MIKASGSRLWRLRYEFEGVEKGISLGIYPDLSLKRARARRDAARRLIAEGIDPSAKRKADKLAVAESFELVTREWLASLARPPVIPKNAKRRRRRHGPMDPKTIARMTKRFETFVFPNLGSRPVRRITAPELLGELRRIEARGTHATAHRVRASIGCLWSPIASKKERALRAVPSMKNWLGPLVALGDARSEKRVESHSLPPMGAQPRCPRTGSFELRKLYGWSSRALHESKTDARVNADDPTGADARNAAGCGHAAGEYPGG